MQYIIRKYKQTLNNKHRRCSLEKIIIESVEFTNLGLNHVTTSALITIVLTIFQAWCLWHQRQTIVKKNSAKSVSANLFVFNGFYLLSFMVYGVSKQSLAIVFNGGLLGLLFLLIICGIYKYKEFTLSEKITLVLSPFMIPAMSFVENKEAFLFILLFVTAIFVAMQAAEIIVGKDVGSLDKWMIIGFLVNCVVWSFYGFATKEWVIFGFNTAGSVVYSLGLVLWYHYKNLKI